MESQNCYFEGENCRGVPKIGTTDFAYLQGIKRRPHRRRCLIRNPAGLLVEAWQQGYGGSEADNHLLAASMAHAMRVGESPAALFWFLAQHPKQAARVVSGEDEREGARILRNVRQPLISADRRSRNRPSKAIRARS